MVSLNNVPSTWLNVNWNIVLDILNDYIVEFESMSEYFIMELMNKQIQFALCM